MKKLRRSALDAAVAGVLASALLVALPTAVAHGSGSAGGVGVGVGSVGGHGAGGHGVGGGARGIGHRSDGVAGDRGWDGHGYHHGYGCCGWGDGFDDPYWDPYLWVDYGPWDPYAYAAPTIASAGPDYPYVQPAPAYWYYCADSRTYYPYVRQCTSAWSRVVPIPAR